MIVFSLRTKTWKRVGLEQEINGKVNLIDDNFKVGDIGRSISRIAPSGKAMFNDKMIEVHSLIGFIDQDVEIQITQIKNNKVFIKKV